MVRKPEGPNANRTREPYIEYEAVTRLLDEIPLDAQLRRGRQCRKKSLISPCIHSQSSRLLSSIVILLRRS